MKVLFVIPTLFENPETIDNCLNGLLSSLENVIYEYDIWVIANTESQLFNDWNPPAGVSKDCSGLKFSIAKALNLGISKKTDHDYFCYIDEGMRCESGWLDFVYEIYNKYNNVGIIGNRPHSTFKHYHIELEDGIYEVLWSDGIMFTKFDRVESIGGYNESYFGDCETQEFCYQLIDKGYTNLFLHSDVLAIQHTITSWHKEDELLVKSNNSRKLFDSKWETWKTSKFELLKDKF